MTVFLRVLELSVDEKPEALLRVVAGLRDQGEEPLQGALFEREPASFRAAPGSPFAYWVSETVLAIFRDAPRLHSGGTSVVSTNPLNDDFRYIRAWWEIPCDRAEAWKSWAKGGAYSPIYYDVDTVVRWDRHRESYYGFLGTESRQRIRPVASVQHFFRPGLTWPRRTQSGLGMRAMPDGCIFADKGPAAFVEGDKPLDLLALLAVTTSSPFRYLVELQMAFGSYEVGVIQRTPVPELSETDVDGLAQLARRAWSLKRRLDTTNETSHAFVLPRDLNEKITGLNRVAVERELAAIQGKNDDRAFGLYGISPNDRATIEASAKNAVPGAILAVQVSDDEPDDDASEEDESPMSAPADTLLCWYVGVAFGRFDKRLATGEREVPPEPEPFEPLPSRSPGMWPEGEPRNLLPPEVLVDDPGHERELVTHVTQASIGTSFDVPYNLRQWLAQEFFPLHIKMYSKSRRKAPIYWQLATSSASYSVWLYLHAFTKDTLYKVQNEYVAPKLAHEERKLESLRKELGESARAAERKSLAEQESFVEELRAFLDEVKRIAPLWNPDLDDGVIINFAPLWRLVPHHKLWQKELKATWDALCTGKYDWAHLAMHLWPERVVPKCATDRSLAIAHELEEVFWVEGANGKWTARTTPLRPIDELVQERTSPAVKAALQSLLDAPVAQTRKTSTRSKRAR